MPIKERLGFLEVSDKNKNFANSLSLQNILATILRKSQGVDRS